MKKIYNMNLKLRSMAATLLLAMALSFFGNAVPVLAHGGEDHGEAKPATATTTAGTVTRSVQLGDFEIMFKHSPLEPDTATPGRLFITKFATNEAAGDVNPALEIESATGSVTEIPVEKSAAAAGSYVARIPALPEGTYTLRAKVTYGGETDTATFSGVEVAHAETAAEATGSSWTETALFSMMVLIALGLFGGLAYFALRAFKDKPLGEKTVSA